MDGTWLRRPEATLHKGTASDHFFVSRSLAVSPSPPSPQASPPAPVLSLLPGQPPPDSYPEAPPPSGPSALRQDGARRFCSGGSELTLLRKGRRGKSRRVGDPPWGCGWGGGRSCGIHIWSWREGERLAGPWEPSRGPRAGGVGGSRSERLTTGRRRDGPGSRRPAPGGLLRRPSSGAARGRPQFCLGGCGGNRREGWTKPSLGGPAGGEEGAGCSGRPLRGQA